ncbi:cytochrome P450 [Ganoderma sinense ZZ0214-1]|uniref:Cytochrome P450 n=1 Tax=Ganoderma sinense ZZ0214-1 TaxID=1077348 RepID=A0A2G8SHX1_9APHY|nr:cytochrome P450 [Ganoderma sinense ZZ0214-1]
MDLLTSLLLALVLLGALTWTIRRRLATPPSLRNLPGPKSPSWLKGNTQQLMGRHSNEWNKQTAETYGPLSRLTGPFARTWLNVYDPKALYSIAIKDQDIWLKNAAAANVRLLGPGLLTTQGAQHRKQRKMLTPVFSTAYLRGITSVFYDTTHKLRDGLIADIGATDSKEVDVLKWMGRAALELLGQGALGYSFDPLVGDTTNDFAEAVKSFFAALNALSVFRLVAMPFLLLGGKLPSRVHGMLIDAIPSRRVQRVKHIVRTMRQRSVEIVAEKRAALAKGDASTVRQVDEGKDIMSILLQANMAASEKEKLSDEELTAQISTFILAGMDTTSNATARLLHLLSLHPDIQKKLRDEILEAQAGEEVSYDRLNELPYLDSVCRETLRLYGPVRTLARRAMEDTVLPLHEPVRGTDGTWLTEVAVPKGTVAILNLWACNTNKAVWGEDAHEWRPERFLAPLPRSVEAARIPGVYANLMSFHGGSRSCIGFKYAQLELKVVLAVLLANFTFEPSARDKDVVWNNAGVAYPSVGRDSKKPELPLKVSPPPRA